MHKSRNVTAIVFTLLWAAFLFQAGPVSGQEAPPPTQAGAETAAPVEKDKAESSTLSTLVTIIDSLDSLKAQLVEKEDALKAAGTDERKKNISSDIEELNSQLEELRRNFERIATSVDVEAFEARPKQEIDWKEEVQDLLGPVLQELKSMTDRPRQIEKLRSEAAYYKERIPIATRALENIREMMSRAQDEELKSQLQFLERDWQNKKNQLTNQLTVTEYQLREKQKEKKSLFESTQNILKIFFKSRGRNFLFAVLGFLIVFLLLRYMHRAVYKYSPIHKSGDRSFFVRLTDVLYHVFTFAGAIGALLIVLYVSGDWVLLSLVIIFIIGLAWTAKQGLPRFWEQIKLLLNLGTVRENERLMYNGIPWKVVSLNIYTHLENPDLKFGRIRLPLRSLVDYHSRPYASNESWFPSREGDWVLLSDDTHGKVVSQNPELVRLVLRGGSLKTYTTGDYIAQSPLNLSTNFRRRVTFGIDYMHQAISTAEIPEKLGAMLKDELEKAGYGKHIMNLRVDFKTAGASSLDMEVIADFSGDVAEFYKRLERTIQRICVDACNRYGWVIPFTQLTLHTAESPDAADA